MMKLTLSQTAEFLQARDHFAILTHVRPDGDTLGSAAALCRILRALGKTAHILRDPEISPDYRWLYRGLTMEQAAAGDTIVCVDVAAAQLLPAVFRPYLGHIALRIDHHGGRDSFTDAEYVDGSRGACTEIIHELAEALQVSIDAPTADAIYTGLITDTFGFRFANTTAHTLAVAAACLSAGARNFEINQMVFEENLLQRLKLQNHIADHLRRLADGRLAMVTLPWQLQQAIGATEDDVNNVLNFLQALTGAQVAATLVEDALGYTRLSVRSLPGGDCTPLAAAFGGGGHTLAAGANTTLPLSVAEAAVESEMLSQFTEGDR